MAGAMPTQENGLARLAHLESLDRLTLETILQNARRTSLPHPDDDEAFMSFLKDTVLNSFDGEPLPDEIEAILQTAAMSGGSCSLFMELDRNASVTGGASGSTAAAAAAAVAKASGAGSPAPAPTPVRTRAAAALGSAEDDGMEEEGSDDAVAAADALLAAAAAPTPRASRKRRRSDDGAAAVGGSAPAPAVEDDTASVDTMPMPTRRRRIDTDEVASFGGANDLVEPPSAATTSGGGAAVARGASGAVAAAAAAAAAGGAARRAARRAGGGPAGAPEGTLNNAAAAEAEGVFKAVLVAKVLTKSDASSKRIILPRIAIEANLPELTAPGTRASLAFDALDTLGREWPLVIKAWANGSNPKPVYVLEGRVGDLMKADRLGPGDVVGVLKSKDGRYFVHVNTPQVREAAARPTFCAFAFEQHEAEQKAAAEAAEKKKKEEEEAAAKDGGGGGANSGDAGAGGSGGGDEAGGSGGGGGGGGGTALAGRTRSGRLLRSGAAAPAADKPQAMTAVPISSVPLAPGMPVSPCEVLVMGPPGGVTGEDGASAEAPGVAAGVPSARPPSYLRLDSQSSAVVEWTDPGVAAAAAAAAAAAGIPMPPDAAAAASAAGGGRRAVTPDPDAPAERVGAIVHQGGALLCPRTPGCTRPAGHQGWCVGRKMQQQEKEKQQKKK